MPKRAQQPAFVAQLQLQFQGKFTQAKKEGGVERERGRKRGEMGSRIAKVAQKKGKNTLRRQIKNVNIIVCVIVQGWQWACREWEGGSCRQDTVKGAGPGCKDVFELGAKKVNNDICHCFALAQTHTTLECLLPPLFTSPPFCRCTFSFLSLILDKLLQSNPPPFPG